MGLDNLRILLVEPGHVRVGWDADVEGDHKVLRRKYLGRGRWGEAVEKDGPTLIDPGPAVFDDEGPTSPPAAGSRYAYGVSQRTPPGTGPWLAQGDLVEALPLSTNTTPGVEVGTEAVMTAVLAWAQEAVGGSCKVIPQFKDGPRPDKPYVSIALLGPSKVGGTDEERTDGVEVLQCGLRRWGVRVQSYGPKAHEIAGALQTATESPGPLRHLENAGLSVSDVGQPTDLAELLGDKHEERVLFEFGVYAANNASVLPEYPAESIETLAATGTLGDNEVNVTAPPE